MNNWNCLIFLLSLCYIPVSPQILSTEWVEHTRYIQQSSTGVRHKIHDTCTHVWKNQLYECLRKNVISTLKINIFLKFNNQWNGGYLLVPLIFEFKIKKYFKKRYDAFYKTPVQIPFENHHFLKFKNQRYRNSLVLSLVVEFF